MTAEVFLSHCSPVESSLLINEVNIYQQHRDHIKRVYTGIRNAGKRISKRKLLRKAYPNAIPAIAHHAVYQACNPVCPDNNAKWLFIAGADAGWIRENCWNMKLGSLRLSVNTSRLQKGGQQKWPDGKESRLRGCFFGFDDDAMTIRLIGRNIKTGSVNTDPLSEDVSFISSCWYPHSVIPGEKPRHVLKTFCEKIEKYAFENHNALPILSYEVSKKDVRMKMDANVYWRIKEQCNPHAYLLNASLARYISLHEGIDVKSTWKRARESKMPQVIGWLQHGHQESVRLRLYGQTRSWISMLPPEVKGAAIPALLFLAHMLKVTRRETGIKATNAGIIPSKVSSAVITLCPIKLGAHIQSQTIARSIEEAAQYCIEYGIHTPYGAVLQSHRLLKTTPFVIPSKVAHLPMQAEAIL